VQTEGVKKPSIATIITKIRAEFLILGIHEFSLEDS
jgi:hypothetical protein